ncbi:hypothetical protein DL93DRAFT_1832142 [Clavulina sp. PMI_390]|nr:hypothetical protein DL93DRAFT_1832142 [Clavulina sp. PMI_390]
MDLSLSSLSYICFSSPRFSGVPILFMFRVGFFFLIFLYPTRRGRPPAPSLRAPSDFLVPFLVHSKHVLFRLSSVFHNPSLHHHLKLYHSIPPYFLKDRWTGCPAYMKLLIPVD